MSRPKPDKKLILDLDSSVRPTHAHQEGTAYNGHFACTCYHPLFCFNQYGDLERPLLRKGHVHTAVDVLDFTSRVMTEVVPTQHQRDAQAFVATLATYQEAEDLINIGAYVRGSNRRIDYALDKIEAMIAYLKQPIEQRASLEESQAVLEQMFADFQW